MRNARGSIRHVEFVIKTKAKPDGALVKLVKANSAASAPLPDFVEPMQAKLVDSMRPGDWIYEIKFDGYRALAMCGGSQTRILSRNQNDQAKDSPK
jgi:bifunctional non-homologous end joining protein LigD